MTVILKDGRKVKILNNCIYELKNNNLTKIVDYFKLSDDEAQLIKISDIEKIK